MESCRLPQLSRFPGCYATPAVSLTQDLRPSIQLSSVFSSRPTKVFRNPAQSAPVLMKARLCWVVMDGWTSRPCWLVVMGVSGPAANQEGTGVSDSAQPPNKLR